MFRPFGIARVELFIPIEASALKVIYQYNSGLLLPQYSFESLAAQVC